MEKICKKLVTNLYGMWKKHDKNMKKHLFKTEKISNFPNKKKIDKNKNIVL
jgi:hypothetical protein